MGAWAKGTPWREARHENIEYYKGRMLHFRIRTDCSVICEERGETPPKHCRDRFPDEQLDAEEAKEMMEQE